jgi:TRAP-type C4-dicarboxylate transport system substrate-binding protein
MASAPQTARLTLSLLLGCLALLAGAGSLLAQPAPLRLKIIGGLAGVTQYTQHEAPFWQNRVPQLTAGVVQAEIAPFDRSGIRGQELLRLLRLGVVSYANVLLGLAAADEPELDALTLPLVSRDQAELRRNAALLRPGLARVLRERYGVELLAIYIYPAQVMLCRGAFAGLGDLAGRRIRASSAAQADLLAGLGAIPVVMPFAEVVPAMRDGVVQCAITGAMPAVEVGLPEVATHISALPINWGVSVFVANQGAWQALPETIRERLQGGIATLEEDIWRAADLATQDGIACATGLPPCPPGRRGRLQLVAEPSIEAFQHRILRDVVVPGWLRRCGSACTAIWNGTMGPGLGIRAEGG